MFILLISIGLLVGMVAITLLGGKVPTDPTAAKKNLL